MGVWEVVLPKSGPFMVVNCLEYELTRFYVALMQLLSYITDTNNGALHVQDCNLCPVIGC